MSQQLRYVYPDADALARAAATEITQLALNSISERGLFTLALAGGSTPKKLYSLLATDPDYRDFPWQATHLFFSDERHVPPTHLDSNYLMVHNSLMATGLIPGTRVHRIRAELPDADQAAADYEVELRTFFTNPAMRLDDFPRFDLILLGMGSDGHTASLFPGSKGLEEKERWVISNWVEKFKADRVTFTFPVLNAARNIHFLIAGEDKAGMLDDVLVRYSGQSVYPVQRVKPVDGTIAWLLDAAAAERLPKML